MNLEKLNYNLRVQGVTSVSVKSVINTNDGSVKYNLTSNLWNFENFFVIIEDNKYINFNLTSDENFSNVENLDSFVSAISRANNELKIVKKVLLINQMK